MTNRTAITTLLWIMRGMAAIVAMLLTFVAASIARGDMAPVAGKPLTLGALLVLPLQSPLADLNAVLEGAGT